MCRIERIWSHIGVAQNLYTPHISDSVKFRFLGGASKVGSLGLLAEENGMRLLFDYGMTPTSPPEYPMPAPEIDALFLSHAHVDHSGMVPWIVSRYEVDVFATEVTALVSEVLLEDILKVSDYEGYPAQFYKRDVKETKHAFRYMDFGDSVDVGGLEITAHSAGHIPGASMYEIDTGRKRYLFTGDIHTINTRLVWAAHPVKTDVLIMESTYAGREHPERKQHEREFLEDVEEVISRGGKAIIPAFGVGRTQEMMLLLAGRGYEVWVDGMGKGISYIYLDHPNYIRSVSKLKKAIKGVSMVRGRRDREIASKNADVIITTSGMMDGGPVLYYVEAIKNDPKSAILITGYQVEGTNGRRLVETGELDLYGVMERIGAEVRQYDFSAHAGHSDLVEFAKACEPETIVLMHGDQRDVLAEALSEFDVIMPDDGEEFEL